MASDRINIRTTPEIERFLETIMADLKRRGIKPTITNAISVALAEAAERIEQQNKQ